MKKILSLIPCLLFLGCSSPDPILPGERTPIFKTDSVVIKNTDANFSGDVLTNSECNYTIDENNVIWDGDKKIFSGFKTNTIVKTNRVPTCANGFVYGGLSTGEVVKVNPKTREIKWIADCFKEHCITGGSPLLDIIAPIVVDKNSVYVSSLDDYFCSLNNSNGNKNWCNFIGTAHKFTISGNTIFVMGLDGYLYAIDTKNGDIHWGSRTKKSAEPILKGDKITVGNEEFNALNGQKI